MATAVQPWRLNGSAKAAETALTARAVMLVSGDRGLRTRLKECLTPLRWVVTEADGGAEAMALLEQARPEAMIVDAWLRDLEVVEFVAHVRVLVPGIELLRLDGADVASSANAAKSPRRNELLHAIRVAEDGLPVPSDSGASAETDSLRPPALFRAERGHPAAGRAEAVTAISEMIGESLAMKELARMIRLVAPRTATVLIEGETGTGKEVVAKALHRLSRRAGKPFVVLNCAAIPEALLEAELFGHTRGAFTGAVTSRTGRIEAAHGGTLFLDEIGEMPLPLQSKMLRFLECGELQKVGENETVRVDVRVIAATHQHLLRRAEEKTFRLDLYHRLAVFPIEVPALRDRIDDLPLLVEHFLEELGREHPRKRISGGALARLVQYEWPGNVRELMHVLERASILADDRAEIGLDEIRLRASRRT